jgi:branched-chain amino acid transport system permease protein
MRLVPQAPSMVIGQAQPRSRGALVSKWSFLAVALVIAAFLPYITSSFVINLATQVLLFGLFALSINIISGYGGMVTLGHAGLLGAAGYALGIFTVHSGVALGPALVLSLGVSVCVSVFFGALAVRARGTYFVMITLAEGMVVWGIAQRWQELTGGENGITGIPKPAFATAYWQYYYVVLVVVAICTLLVARFVRSPFGLSLKGIREAEDRLPSLGYNVGLHKLVAFTISGAFAGVAGLLLAMFNNFIGPSNVFFLASAQGLLMSILGGVGTLSGAYIGSTVVVIIQNWVSSYVARWQTLLGVIFVLVIVFAPDGIVGAWTRWVWMPILQKLGVHKADASKSQTTQAATADTGSDMSAQLFADTQHATGSTLRTDRAEERGEGT